MYVRMRRKKQTNNVLHIQNSLMSFRKVDKFKVYVYTCFLVFLFFILMYSRFFVLCQQLLTIYLFKSQNLHTLKALS
jgi:hypothetical protein